MPARPRILERLVPVWEAYQRCSRSRQYGQGYPQHFTLSEIVVALRLAGFPEEHLDYYVDIVQELDGEWIKASVEKAEVTVTKAG